MTLSWYPRPTSRGLAVLLTAGLAVGLSLTPSPAEAVPPGAPIPAEAVRPRPPIPAEAVRPRPPIPAEAVRPRVPAPQARRGRVPTPEARRAGVQPGNAFMGWRASAQSTNPVDQPRRRSMRPLDRVPGVRGIDVASYQRRVDWRAQLRAGKRFAYVKATEGTSYRNPYFGSQYGGAASTGFIRGAYHFANPAGAAGWRQADYFIAHGGGWTRDGRTLPGVLDIEYNPYGATCWGVSQSEMVSWVRSFTTRYRDRTGRDAVIYTTTDWWSRCTGNSTAFSRTNPLWIARYASAVGTLPGRWPFYTFWQYSDRPIDQDYFSASYTRLRILATG